MTRRLQTLLVLTFLTLASLAHAGHWVTTYSGGTGTPNSFSGSSIGGGGPSPYAMFNDGAYGGGGSGASGAIVATLTWTPDGPSDTSSPPATIYVLETCTASGGSDNGGGPSSSPAAKANAGFGGKDAPVVSHPYYGTYVQYTADTTETRVSLQSVFGNSVQVTASPYAAGGISASVHYSAAQTDLAVSIFSDRDESFHKGPNGPVATPRIPSPHASGTPGSIPRATLVKAPTTIPTTAATTGCNPSSPQTRSAVGSTRSTSGILTERRSATTSSTSTPRCRKDSSTRRTPLQS